MTTYELAACPVCRSQDARTLATRDEIRRELEALWQFHLRRLLTGAPIDQLFDRAIFSQQPPLQVMRCSRCGTVFRNPREREDEIVETYQQEAPSETALASLFTQQQEFYRPRAARLTRLAGGVGDVLEVGSYVGGFLRAAAEQGWHARGIDANEHATAFARAQGSDVEACALDHFMTSQRFKAIALWNCFEQLPDPHDAIARATELLQPRGLLALRVPNGACYAALRKGGAGTRALLAWNNLASFPYRHGFTPGSLARLLGEHGYRIVARSGDALVSIAGEYTRGWARREERVIKAGTKLLPGRLAPWLEVYARRNSD
jgi:2-polyprenyl-3-methyl-5-hydroxy-6-metoxy-1,4-benzoquinol methylase